MAPLSSESGSSHVLIVDDDARVRQATRNLLVSKGFACAATSDPRVAKGLLDSRPFHVMLADVTMPYLSGLHLLAHARQRGGDCRVILTTSLPAAEFLTEALRRGAYDFLPKPVEPEELVAAVSRAAAADPSSPLQTIDVLSISASSSTPLPLSSTPDSI